MQADDSPQSSLEAPVAVRCDRITVMTYGSLLIVTAAAWVQLWSAAMAHDMGGMDMPMAPTVFAGVLYVAGWTVMMTAMMLPSALPMMALYAATQRNTPGAVAKAAAIAQFTLVYLGLWALTGVPIYLGSVALGALVGEALAYGVALVLVAAGIFQFTPLKRMCLRNCRSPLGFLLAHWRPGWRGSLTLGLAHAVYCLGCCWALMLVLVAAGAMGLPWVLLIAAIVAAEKLLPHPEWITRVTGLALMLLGVAVALRPDLALVLRGGGHAM
jgi:predicted metal-binding membrane protein